MENPCQRFLEITEKPDDLKVTGLNVLETTEMALHLNECAACQQTADNFFKESEKDENIKTSPGFGLLFNISFQQAELEKRRNGKGEESKVKGGMSKEEKQASSKKELTVEDIEEAIEKFLVYYPRLQPKHYRALRGVPFFLLFCAQNCLIRLAENMAKEGLGEKLEKIELRTDGSLIVNANPKMKMPTMGVKEAIIAALHAFNKAQPGKIFQPSINDYLICALLAWVYHAHIQHPDLLTPFDIWEEPQALGPWRIDPRASHA